MDALLRQVQDSVEGQIDFNGQHATDVLCTILLSLTATIAFITGYIQRDVYMTMWTGLGGTLLTMLVVVPPWPLFNQHPEAWLPSNKPVAGLPAGGIVVGGMMNSH